MKRALFFGFFFLALTIPAALLVSSCAGLRADIASTPRAEHKDQSPLEQGLTGAMLLTEAYAMGSGGSVNPNDPGLLPAYRRDLRLAITLALKAEHMWKDSGIDHPDVSAQFDRVINALYAANYFEIAGAMRDAQQGASGGELIRAVHGEMEARRLACTYLKKTPLVIDLPESDDAQGETLADVCNEI